MASSGLLPDEEGDETLSYVHLMEPPYVERKGIFAIIYSLIFKEPVENTGYPEVSHQSQYS